MNKSLILSQWLLFLLFSCGGPAKNIDQQAAAKEDPQPVVIPQDTSDLSANVRKIEQQAKAIDEKLAAYSKTEKTVLGLSAEGSTLIGYYEKKDIRKMSVIHYGEMGKASEEYYYDEQGALMIFVLEELEYDQPISGEGVIVIGQSKRRYYFNEGKLIRGAGDMESGNQDELVKNIFLDSQKYQEMLKSKEEEIDIKN